MGETPKTALPTLLRRYRYANTTQLAPKFIYAKQKKDVF
jgi:hypothetical protein